ncbi:hypothetical protein HRbin23_01383 [bacterium HR23]|nr:hypothetical protein HRbin23_01383 [bacterium HR23]
MGDAPQGLHRLTGLANRLQDLLGIGKKGLARLGEQDASSPPEKEGLTEVPLQGLHTGAQGRLAQIEGFGRLAEGAGAHHRHEGLQLADVHPSLPMIEFGYLLKGKRPLLL